MTTAIAALRDGHAFQSRIFWRKALNLLDPDNAVARVGFETGPKGFDDIWVEYHVGKGPVDQFGDRLVREHTQCKWHVTGNEYGYSDLVDPEFINASTRSLMQRARAAQLEYAADGVGIRFKFLTNWNIKKEDALNPLISQRQHSLRIEEMFKGTTDRSKSGALRKLWREHLEIDDDELRKLARTLAFATDTSSLDDHRVSLDPLLALKGLRRVPATESSFVYDDVMYQWLGQGRLIFDAVLFRKICQDEKLFEAQATPRFIYGVKSFEHAFDRLEERCSAVLNLINYFDERAIRSQSDWEDTLYPQLKEFLSAAAIKQDQLRLIMDAHVTLAFAAGSVLDIKSGRFIEIEQRSTSRNIWNATDQAHDATWPGWSYELQIVDETKPDIAVAVCLTHDVTPQVQAYLKTTPTNIGRLLIARPSSGPGNLSVTCGRHAFELAETLAQEINRERAAGNSESHLFMAGPNAFSFFLGQRRASLGATTLYEYDFDGSQGRTYVPSISFPIQTVK
jgi:hypothetical protein